MNNLELLSPVGDFKCLRAAVQNGADAVYLGASSFSARALATNFDYEDLKKAIQYAKLRNVKVHLALNTLLKENELNEAISLATFAYNCGIDAIIVQDLGFAKFLIDNFKGLEVHASTQMSIHNLQGVKALESLGFSRVVLSREVSLDEIKNICKNVSIEIETFIHGALCISYSGQCLFSSMIGARSGNRGKCGGPCRLPYKLINSSDKVLDSGHLLSPKDLCSLDLLPELIKSGVTSFKIEGRLKNPEYVATVTRIYRKYIDLALNNEQKYIIDEKDKLDLLQVFNRGNFSTGHLENQANMDLIYPKRADNQGVLIGKVYDFNSNKGYVSFKTLEDISIGDKICIANKEKSNYTISELMIGNSNFKKVEKNTNVKIGRMKGDISRGYEIYRISSKELLDTAFETYNGNEFKKIKLNAKLSVKLGFPIILEVSVNNGIYNENISITSDIIPEKAVSTPITKERLISQIYKTGNTEFEFEDIVVDLEDNLFIPKISGLNELRRTALLELENSVLSKHKHDKLVPKINFEKSLANIGNSQKISALLNILNVNFDYSSLKGLNSLYIPLKYFLKVDFSSCLKYLSKTFPIYIYLPTIARKNYINIIDTKLDNIVSEFKICGFVVSNISELQFVKKYNLDIIANYTFNIFNTLSANELQSLGFTKFTISPELDKPSLQEFLPLSSISCELIVYGNTPIMNSNYCLLGKTNKCIASCNRQCTNCDKFYLKDNLGFSFRILPDAIDTITTIYNSRITSISTQSFEHLTNSFRIDILDENVQEINNVIDKVTNNQKLEGKEYTNGNLNRII